mmetsp:Transcript_18772/g.54282  ORF Transcript_18772/g.54282 Transcript_18772/m.54282 type:complete len:271 (+) Transcript_18772:3396-4208(+)
MVHDARLLLFFQREHGGILVQGVIVRVVVPEPHVARAADGHLVSVVRVDLQARNRQLHVVARDDLLNLPTPVGDRGLWHRGDSDDVPGVRGEREVHDPVLALARRMQDLKRALLRLWPPTAGHGVPGGRRGVGRRESQDADLHLAAALVPVVDRSLLLGDGEQPSVGGLRQGGHDTTSILARQEELALLIVVPDSQVSPHSEGARVVAQRYDRASDRLGEHAEGVRQRERRGGAAVLQALRHGLRRRRLRALVTTLAANGRVARRGAGTA